VHLNETQVGRVYHRFLQSLQRVLSSLTRSSMTCSVSFVTPFKRIDAWLFAQLKLSYIVPSGTVHLKSTSLVSYRQSESALIDIDPPYGPDSRCQFYCQTCGQPLYLSRAVNTLNYDRNIKQMNGMSGISLRVTGGPLTAICCFFRAFGLYFPFVPRSRRQLARSWFIL